MIRVRVVVAMAVAAMLIAADGRVSAQDNFGARVPNGLALSEFRGYETWQVVAVSQAEHEIEVILGNPTAIAAYQGGAPGNGKPFPDGTRLAKIHWNAKRSQEAPAPTTVPDSLHDIDFMVKNASKFSDSGGWGYAQFNYSIALNRLIPLGTGAVCGYACHTIVKTKDFVFTAYPRR